LFAQYKTVCTHTIKHVEFIQTCMNIIAKAKGSKFWTALSHTFVRFCQCLMCTRFRLMHSSRHENHTTTTTMKNLPHSFHYSSNRLNIFSPKKFYAARLYITRRWCPKISLPFFSRKFHCQLHYVCLIYASNASPMSLCNYFILFTVCRHDTGEKAASTWLHRQFIAKEFFHFSLINF
jgi:hypothetical protein